MSILWSREYLLEVSLLLLLSRFSRVQLCNPRDGSPPGSPVPGILQARTLEWLAISFSNAWKMKVKSLSRVRLLATPWTAAYQAPPSMGFPRQEYWSGVPLPSPKVGVAILKWDKTDSKTKAIKKDKEADYIMIKGSIQEEDITLVNTHT